MAAFGLPTILRCTGRLLAKAIIEEQTIAPHFCRPFLKTLLGLPVTLSDLMFKDSELFIQFNKLLKALANDPAMANPEHPEGEDWVEDLSLDFTLAETVHSAKSETSHELLPGGEGFDVTRENLGLYIQLMAKHYVLDKVSSPMNFILRGFYEVLPFPFISVFHPSELELLLCGLPSIDVGDWRRNTFYSGGLHAAHRSVVWFWKTVSSFCQSERAQFLQYVTGTRQVPVGGFAALQGRDGHLCRFHLVEAIVRFPVAHTCFNRLDIPRYKTEGELIRHLNLLLKTEATGFTAA